MSIRSIYPGTCMKNMYPGTGMKTMSSGTRQIWIFALLLISAMLAGCASDERAPVTEHGAAVKQKVAAEPVSKKTARNKDWRPEVLIVQKGDTLYSIALNYGFDYHELADLNGIKDPKLISIGQEIHLFKGKAKAVIPAATVEAKPTEILLKDQPKLVKYPYSEAAMAQIDKVQEQAKPEVTAKVESKPKPESKPEMKPEAKPETKPETDSATDDGTEDGEEAALGWGMPTKGKLIAQFSESANRKGIDFAGKLGQPILASAPGKVVYSGSGLRGYGNLIIIKHNKTFLTAYAHNDKLLVKEGQNVTRGQKIAEMGKTDSDQVKLHFEVRLLGKPVDPAKYLPLGKS